MANEPDMVPPDHEKRLKYLEFVQVAAIYAVVCFAAVYEYAKENSGPLRTGVQAVEDTVKTVVGPVYDKFHDVPFELLLFVDRKVAESLEEVERHVPELVRQAASEVHRAGVVDAARSVTRTMYGKYEPGAREFYAKYEPVAETYAVSAWRRLNRLPLFPQVAQIAVPTAAYWSDKYNRSVCLAADRGLPAVSFLPLIPVDRIAKVFDEGSACGAHVPMSTNGEAH